MLRQRGCNKDSGMIVCVLGQVPKMLVLMNSLRNFP
jgi:hypothetical protein